VDEDATLLELMRSIASGGRDRAAPLVAADPRLATAALVGGATRSDPTRHFFPDQGEYVYTGDTALHVAGFCHDVPTATVLIAAGADVRARNRRGAEPLHAAASGSPDSASWNPADQVETIGLLIDAGAVPDARTKEGATALHRAVRNRCAAAVAALLAGGADPGALNGRGTTPLRLAETTSGRSGSGSPAARAAQARIVELLVVATGG
jgi:hypothetical protein